MGSYQNLHGQKKTLLVAKFDLLAHDTLVFGQPSFGPRREAPWSVISMNGVSSTHDTNGAMECVSYVLVFFFFLNLLFLIAKLLS